MASFESRSLTWSDSAVLANYCSASAARRSPPSAAHVRPPSPRADTATTTPRAGTRRGSGTRLGLGWDAPQGHFTEGSISSENALAIAFDLVSGSDLSPSDLRCLAGAKPVEENKKALAKALADRIVAADQHIQNDMYGSRYEFNILSEYGYTDIALKAVTQTGLPGYVHRITQGTTSLWEQWTDRLPVNHHYRSNVATWFYQSLAGTKPTSTAYESLRIRPFISSAAVNSRVPKDTQDTDPSPAMLSHVSVSIDTVRGKVCPEWHHAAGREDRPDGHPSRTTPRPRSGFPRRTSP